MTAAAPAPVDLPVCDLASYSTRACHCGGAMVPIVGRRTRRWLCPVCKRRRH